LWTTRSRRRISPSGPVTDFRGERIPKRIRLDGLILNGWAPGVYVSVFAAASGKGRRQSMAKLNPFKFMQEVRQETNKVTWPSRRETAITTAMVFVFAALAAVFFLLADQVIRIVVTLVLGIAS
jgi:preprotein translocase subunit SecE